MYKSKKPYFYGTGRRKSSVARVHLFPNGTGSITISSPTALVPSPSTAVTSTITSAWRP